MGREINFIIILISIILGVSACADFELHVKKEGQSIKPSVILIGPFETRNMNYDPYVSEEFKDALKFEFFRRGYNAVLISKSDPLTSTGTDWAAKTSKDNAGDILIKGVISQRESGFLADREIETLVSFTIYSSNGAIIGEGFYHDSRSAGEESLRRSAADKFVSEFIKNLGRVD